MVGSNLAYVKSTYRRGDFDSIGMSLLANLTFYGLDAPARAKERRHRSIRPGEVAMRLLARSLGFFLP